jgi:P-type conjugative transfer protein TrbG
MTRTVRLASLAAVSLFALTALFAAPSSARAAETSAVPLAQEAPDGSIRYPYGGRFEPTLVCRPLFICDVILEQGETVINLGIGDSVRWVIASAQSGPSGSTPHVFVKPTQTNLATNLVITTSKRVYYLRLVSSPDAPNPRLSFSYPEEAAAEAAAQAATEEQKIEEKASEIPLLPPDQLDYKYRIVGAPEILPAKVYNDGVHTFIEFAALPTDLPVVFAVAPDGSEQIANFRLHERTFIVDGIQSGFDLVLNAGTGHHGHGQRTVYIRHT